MQPAQDHGPLRVGHDERPPLPIYRTYLPSRRHSGEIKVFADWASTLLAG